MRRFSVSGYTNHFLNLVSAVVVYDLNLGWTFLGPSEADAILFVDPNTVLSLPVAGERLQSISKWDPQILLCLGGVQKIKFSRSHGPQRLRTGASCPRGVDAVEHIFGTLIGEGSDHA